MTRGHVPSSLFDKKKWKQFTSLSLLLLPGVLQGSSPFTNPHSGKTNAVPASAETNRFYSFTLSSKRGSYFNATGKMLKSMSVLKINDNEAIIGFTDEENAKKAYWLNVSGAGKNRKLWKFLGVSKEQETDLTLNLTAEFHKITVADLAKIIARHEKQA